jgi:hypothetical protein
VPGVRDVWPTLAFFGGAVGLFAMALYFHPFYLIAIAINIAIVALVWGRLATAS